MQKLKNPGFEEGTPKIWETYSTGTTQIYRYPEPGRVGGSAVSIEYQTRETGKMALWTQDVLQVDRTTKYKLSGWMKAQNIIGSGASIKVDWKTANGDYLSTSEIMQRQKGTFAWKYFEGIVTPNPNTVNATVALDLYDCSGKVWFDDIFFDLYAVPTKRYKCSGTPNYICIEDPAGPYASLTECQDNCKQPGAIHECNTNNCDLDYKEFRLHNNKWSDPGAVQSVFYYDDGRIGWTWNKPNLTNPNYPEVIVGTNFGMWHPSTSPLFPIKQKDVNTWTSEIVYKYTKVPTGNYNLAYDIYWMDSSFGTKHYNIMIWIYGDLGYGKDIVVSDGINQYYYVHDNRGWPWDAFVLKNQTAPVLNQQYTHKVNIKALIDTIHNGEFENNGEWLIPDLQLGNEVWRGEGRIEVSKYNINLNGSLIHL